MDCHDLSAREGRRTHAGISVPGARLAFLGNIAVKHTRTPRWEHQDSDAALASHPVRAPAHGTRAGGKAGERVVRASACARA